MPINHHWVDIFNIFSRFSREQANIWQIGGKMQKLYQKGQEISRITGEFNDPKLENNFFSYMTDEIITHFRHNLLFISLAFLLFIFPDYFLISDQLQLSILFLIRMLFFLFSILYFYRIIDMPDRLYLFSTIYGLIGTFLFWALVALYEKPDVFIQQQGLIVLILGIFFIVPNRLLGKVLISALLTAGFFAITVWQGLFLISSYFWTLVVFSVLIIIICFLTARRMNRLQRIQFYSTMELDRISGTDSLTGCSNRMKYDEELEKEIARAKRYQLPLSGIMFDLDDFKKVNDTFGHLEGDRVLKKIGLLVSKAIRENDQFFRWGGEEFIILLPNSDQKSAVQLAQRIQEVIRNADFTPVKKLTCSFGVTYLREKDTAADFNQRLDQLQYQAKKNGKDRIVSSEIV